MIEAAMKLLLNLADVQEINIGGRNHTNAKIIPVTEPTQDALFISTLTAVKGYFTINPDAIDLSKAIIHVRSHNQVNVTSAVTGTWIQRHDYLTVGINPKEFPFGRYLPIEDFLIALQTYFVQDDTVTALLKIAGNLTDEASVTLIDDGVTQKTQAKTGITRVENILLPNPVVLAPYRTFLEVDQPASAFVFRLKKGDQGPTAALFEADGGNWQLECISRIHDWLRYALPTATILA